jgi:hypothetical protein
MFGNIIVCIQNFFFIKHPIEHTFSENTTVLPMCASKNCLRGNTILEGKISPAQKPARGPTPARNS